ncbi:helix-turn-helix transcriptional regulator [Nocardia sp. NPDC051463]|uniref:helix-turn-helix domain-containing protein n=1 Tax=Nocardia sp. NPDC051463 TaxID=3154845 RepID=UPI00344D7826
MDASQANALIGANLRALRAKKDYSRAKLSELSGVPVITIRRIEDGERAVLTTTLIVLCRVLDADASEFLDVVQRELKEIGGAAASE